MSIELIVPTLGESITEATVSKWLKKVGESFEVDEPLVEIETDKITVEVPAPSAGVLSEITVQEGKDVNIGGVLGIIGDAAEITGTHRTPRGPTAHHPAPPRPSASLHPKPANETGRANDH